MKQKDLDMSDVMRQLASLLSSASSAQYHTARRVCSLAAKRMDFSEAAARRLNRIASHLAATPQNSCASSLASMVCNSGSDTLSSSRKDSRLLFARQDSSHLPTYSREFRESQASNAGSVSQGSGPRDSRLLFARQGSHTLAYYMRECLDQRPCPAEGDGTPCKQLQSVDKGAELPEIALPPKSNCVKDSLDNYLNVEPLFARAANEEGNKVWPTIDTKHRGRESRVSYVVTIEVPGVQADGIRVEVNEDRLLVSGSRSPECWMDGFKQKEKATYHQKELSQGPFKAQWPLPKNINLDCVSAEFMDGFLRIILPKYAS
ncbi:hypothetical protein GOP47_0022834 [Adiantum capillus-veneris]|uniref:SHSP domain-containing protein n=1 Tax=Adiantum capillus-veneris TaxID=13818 RepID=A0A9D4U710_ADICA|nr:hypothetical protein GOP47_0022834 [Adiantum capillus-veneris]